MLLFERKDDSEKKKEVMKITSFIYIYCYERIN